MVDKPEGWTSHDVVGKLRRITGVRRIGHSGTLDPLATGLLVCFIGRATRAVEFAEAYEKEYAASLRLGTVTDTQDITGSVLKKVEAEVTPEELEAALERFRGEIDQIPPMYSAIKVNGKKLYDIARKGGEVERKPRRVTISRLECTGAENGDYNLSVTCSKGTYIRTLCADIGEALGCGGCMSALRRVRAGAFSLEDAHTLEEIEKNGAGAYLLPVDDIFAYAPPLTADGKAESRIRVGADYPCAVPDGEYRVYGEDGEFLMLGALCAGTMRCVKSFFGV